MKGYVYVLRFPHSTSTTAFYVGKTTRHPLLRLVEHMTLIDGNLIKKAAFRFCEKIGALPVVNYSEVDLNDIDEVEESIISTERTGDIVIANLTTPKFGRDKYPEIWEAYYKAKAMNERLRLYRAPLYAPNGEIYEETSLEKYFLDTWKVDAKEQMYEG